MTGLCTVKPCRADRYAKGMCRKHYNRAAYLAKQEERKAAQRAWHAANPMTEERRESARAATRKWQRTHPEHGAAYYQANKARLKAAHDAWVAAHPEQYRQIMLAVNARRRVRLRGGVTERFTSAEILERDNWTCQLCGEPIDPRIKGRQSRAASIDHIIPVSRGGSHTRDNVQAAHIGCNSIKGNRCRAKRAGLHSKPERSMA